MLLRMESLWLFFIAQMTQTQEEHDMFRNKPTVGSVCKGMCRALSFAHSR